MTSMVSDTRLPVARRPRPTDRLIGTFDYEEYISLKSINDPNEG